MQLRLTVWNASGLPLRRVAGFAIHRTGYVSDFPSIPVIRPNNHVTDPAPDAAQPLPLDEQDGWVLDLRFDDEAGVRWQKYPPEEPLRQVRDDEADPLPTSQS
jgi:hypothetical protein